MEEYAVHRTTTGKVFELTDLKETRLNTMTTKTTSLGSIYEC